MIIFIIWRQVTGPGLFWKTFSISTAEGIEKMVSRNRLKNSVGKCFDQLFGVSLDHSAFSHLEGDKFQGSLLRRFGDSSLEKKHLWVWVPTNRERFRRTIGGCTGGQFEEVKKALRNLCPPWGSDISPSNFFVSKFAKESVCGNPIGSFEDCISQGREIFRLARKLFPSLIHSADITTSQRPNCLITEIFAFWIFTLPALSVTIFLKMLIKTFKVEKIHQQQFEKYQYDRKSWS